MVVANEEVLEYALDAFNNNGRKLWVVQPLVKTEITCITTRKRLGAVHGNQIVWIGKIAFDHDMLTLVWKHKK